MDHEPTRDPRILEAIEACRPGSDDLSAPELSWLATRLEADPQLRADYEKLQETDANLTEAFRDVTVPEGLVERIVARLEAEPRRLPRHQRFRRRWMLAGAGLLALAGTILLAIALLNRTGDENLTASAVCDKAINFFEREADAVEPSKLIDEDPPPPAYPLGPEVALLPDIRWRRIHGFLDLPGVAYDLTRPGSPRATLYVVKCTVPGLPSVPPSRPSLNSRGCYAAAWQTESLVYVLVVQGNPRMYQRVLDLSSGALT